jgi:hypothetical protein
VARTCFVGLFGEIEAVSVFVASICGVFLPSFCERSAFWLQWRCGMGVALHCVALRSTYPSDLAMLREAYFALGLGAGVYEKKGEG